MQTQLQLPLCHESAQRPQVPFFQPLVSAEGGTSRYLPDDYAFCERARRCGYRIHADTTLRLSRLASYAYSWEEAGYARFDPTTLLARRCVSRAGPERPRRDNVPLVRPDRCATTLVRAHLDCSGRPT
jgi:hypothetical protein